MEKGTLYKTVYMEEKRISYFTLRITENQRKTHGKMNILQNSFTWTRRD
jgi:hypothetical protein